LRGAPHYRRSWLGQLPTHQALFDFLVHRFKLELAGGNVLLQRLGKTDGEDIKLNCGGQREAKGRISPQMRMSALGQNGFPASFCRLMKSTARLVMSSSIVTIRSLVSGPVWDHRKELLSNGGGRRDVRFWHLADIDTDAVRVCFRGQSGPIPKLPDVR